MNRKARLLSTLLVLVMLSCAVTIAIAADKIDLTYPTYRVGAHVGAPAEDALLNKYLEKYGDQVNLVIEELPSDVSYADKMKILAATNDLPDVVEGKNGVRELAIKNGQAIDLMPYLEADPDYRAQITEAAIEANLVDGKLYSISQQQSAVGYFYNKEMFDAVDIKPAETWDEFLENCAKLKAAGYTPLALMTGETCWTTNLILASIIGTANEAGNAFMNTKNPQDYDTPEMHAALEMIQLMLSEYTTSDAIGGLYANAANNFCQEKTAMIANGPWMVPEFADQEKSVEGLSDRVGVALWPKNGLITEYFIGYMVCADTEEQQDIAFNFIKEITDLDAQAIRLELEGMMPLSSTVPVSESFAKEYPLVIDLMELFGNVEYRYETVDNIFQPSVIDVFPKYYPELASGKITVDDMIDELNKAVK